MYTLITGASSGIGKALALECASRGMNILLVALPGDDLIAMEKLICERYKVTCYSFGTDLSLNTAAADVYNWVKQKDYTVNILLNNVGIGSKGAFEKLSTEFYEKQINLNILTTCLLTRLFVENLKENAPAYIMNMGSMGGFFSLPEKVVYAATKSFIYSFSMALRMELEGSGVSVSVVCPGGIDSNRNTIASNQSLTGIAKRSILSPEDLAKEVISKMLKGKAVIIPGFWNRFIYGVSKLTPNFLQNMLVRRAFKRISMHKY
jgi:short-subunit dehydrogenase